jgi:D-glycero-D-manno-heptose 1,7-bisphosphate phosphatase
VLTLSAPPAALLLDRDGTLNVDTGWVHRPEDFQWIDGACEAIRWANDRGLLVLVVTNQAGIARGYYSEADFHILMRWVDQELAAHGARIDATYYCPHHPTEGQGDYRRLCDCRKPAPGLIRRALSQWRLDPQNCVMIGDSEHDIAAAAASGVRGVRFLGGNLLDCVRSAVS